MPSIDFEGSTLFYDEQNPNQKEETLLFYMVQQEITCRGGNKCPISVKDTGV